MTSKDFIENDDKVWPEMVPIKPNVSLPYSFSTASPHIFQNNGQNMMIGSPMHGNLFNVLSPVGPSYTISNCNSPGSMGDNMSLIIPNLNTNFNNMQLTSTPQTRVASMIKNINIGSSPHNQQQPNYNSQSDFNSSITVYMRGLLSNELSESLVAAIEIYKLAKIESNRRSLSQTSYLVNSVVSCIKTHFKNQQVVQFCIASLYHMSLDSESIPILFKSEILSIFPLLYQPNTSNVQYYLTVIFHSIFQKCPESHIIFTDLSNLTKFVALLEDKNERMLTVYIDYLNLCFTSISIDFLIQKTTFLKFLGELMHQKTNEKLLHNCCRLLKEISQKTNLKKTINSIGIVELLTMNLLNSSRRIAVTCLFTIRNLSDGVDRNSSHERLISILIRFSANQIEPAVAHEGKKIEEKLLCCSLAILANITCNNPSAKEVMIQKNFVPLLIKTLTLMKCKEVIESASTIIKQLTCKSNLCEQASQQLVRLQGINLMVNVLNYYNSSNFMDSVFIKRTLVGVMVNLAMKKVFFECLLKLRVIQLVAFSLSVTVDNIKHNNGSLGDSTKGPAGLKNCHKLLEVSVMFLYYMLCHEESFKLMSNSPVLIAIFCELLMSSSSFGTLSYVLFFLSELSSNNEGVVLIENTLKSIHVSQISTNFPANNREDENICVSKLKQMCCQLKPNSVIAPALGKLLSNLSKTSIGISFDINTLVSSSVDQPEDNDRIGAYFDINFNNQIESPLTFSPSSSRIFTQN